MKRYAITERNIGMNTNPFDLVEIARVAKTAVRITNLILFGSLTNFNRKNNAIVNKVQSNTSELSTAFMLRNIGINETKAVVYNGNQL